MRITGSAGSGYRYNSYLSQVPMLLSDIYSQKIETDLGSRLSNKIKHVNVITYTFDASNVNDGDHDEKKDTKNGDSNGYLSKWDENAVAVNVFKIAQTQGPVIYAPNNKRNTKNKKNKRGKRGFLPKFSFYKKSKDVDNDDSNAKKKNVYFDVDKWNYEIGFTKNARYYLLHTKFLFYFDNTDLFCYNSLTNKSLSIPFMSQIKKALTCVGSHEAQIITCWRQRDVLYLIFKNFRAIPYTLMKINLNHALVREYVNTFKNIKDVTTVSENSLRKCLNFEGLFRFDIDKNYTISNNHSYFDEKRQSLLIAFNNKSSDYIELCVFNNNNKWNKGDKKIEYSKSVSALFAYGKVHYLMHDIRTDKIILYLTNKNLYTNWKFGRKTDNNPFTKLFLESSQGRISTFSQKINKNKDFNDGKLLAQLKIQYDGENDKVVLESLDCGIIHSRDRENGNISINSSGNKNNKKDNSFDIICYDEIRNAVIVDYEKKLEKVNLQQQIRKYKNQDQDQNENALSDRKDMYKSSFGVLRINDMINKWYQII